MGALVESTHTPQFLDAILTFVTCAFLVWIAAAFCGIVWLADRWTTRAITKGRSRPPA
jgi:hypothetical protein